MLEVLDRLLPSFGGYPGWARGLFLAAIALVLASVGVYAAYDNAAGRRQDASHISLAITPAVLTEKDAQNAAELNHAPPAGTGPFFADLTYREAETGGRSHFVPQQDFLDATRDGGDVAAVSGLSPPTWDVARRPAVLDIKVANNTSRTLYFTQAVLDIARSSPDRRPVLVPMVPIDHVRQLLVLNYGWGRARDVQVRARVQPIGAAGGGITTVALGRVDRVGVADLSTAFARAGVDIPALRPWESPSSAEPAGGGALARAREVLAPFGLDPELGTVALPVHGVVRYRNGRGSLVRLRFDADVPATRGTGFGDYAPPTARYDVVRLAGRDDRYQRVVPLSQRVRPGQTDRFEIPVTAAISSRHDLRVRLSYGRDEAVTSQPISVDVFVPREPPDITQIPTVGAVAPGLSSATKVDSKAVRPGETCPEASLDGHAIRISSTKGKINCAGATALWRAYLDQAHAGAGSGAFLEIDGWRCISASAAAAPHVGSCSKAHGRAAFRVDDAV